MDEKIQDWAFHLQKSVYDEWKKSYPSWKSGFKVFYGPVKKNPDLMIISHNPGGGEENFKIEDRGRFEAGDFTPPETTPYSSDHRMSIQMQRIFSEKYKHFLSSSVTFPIIFFRSRDISELNSQERFQRHAMERFCLLKTKEIIDTIKPKKILVIGFRSVELLERTLGIFDTEEFLHRIKGGRLLARKATKGGTSILSVMHITGSRMNADEKEYIKTNIRNFVSSKQRV